MFMIVVALIIDFTSNPSFCNTSDAEKGMSWEKLVNTKFVDGLATHGAGPSADMVLDIQNKEVIV